jgi:3-hydroxy-9,10-secoandrosta-1,3,5(10)-triene-9,17-dione monooxygenase reductase component
VQSFDSARFRKVLGHFPTGVTVVTGTYEGQVHGLTIGSFTSVSLDPPLVGFLPMSSSPSWQAIEKSGRFCVNVLGCDQGDICWRFAKSTDAGKFDGVLHHAAPGGEPVIEGALAWIDCSIEAVHEMGDHLFVLGRVEHLDASDEPGALPLLFYRGTLGRFAAEAPAD